MKLIKIVDTTLRDGLQAPGIDFSRRQKTDTARRIAQLGVDEIEAGTPAMGDSACGDIRAIAGLDLDARISVWCRAREDDLEMAANCGADHVHISFPVSDILLSAFGKDSAWVFDTLARIVPPACKRFAGVTVGAQDATRTDARQLSAFARAAAACGALRLRVADTVGISRPTATHRLIRRLKKHAPEMSLEFHAHNDLGMATANAVTAAEAGADAVSVTVNGLGERAGNAPLEEVAAALQTADSIGSRINTTGLASLCAHVAELSARPLPAAKPVTGSCVFTHESGIHCAGLLKNPLSYQPFSPQEVGRRDWHMVIGSHSGAAAVRAALEKNGIEMDSGMAAEFAARVRDLAPKNSTPLVDRDLCRLYLDFLKDGKTNGQKRSGELQDETTLHHKTGHNVCGHEVAVW
jgi:homocitrate synthase NifV